MDFQVVGNILITLPKPPTPLNSRLPLIRNCFCSFPQLDCFLTSAFSASTYRNPPWILRTHPLACLRFSQESEKLTRFWQKRIRLGNQIMPVLYAHRSPKLTILASQVILPDSVMWQC